LLECDISLIGPECPVVPVESPPELKTSEQRSDSGNKEMMRVGADLELDLVHGSALSACLPRGSSLMYELDGNISE
jgi:hypothetical protein